ncbi:MAG: hypothetical protein ACKOXO_06655 [Cyanobium sp.]
MHSSPRTPRPSASSPRRRPRAAEGDASPLPAIGPARRGVHREVTARSASQPGWFTAGQAGAAAAPAAASPMRTPQPLSAGAAAEVITLSSERRELLCSVIGLSVKLGLVAVAGVSLMRLAGAYQNRMDRQAEIAAVLELQTAKLTRARARFDELFMIAGEQRLIREQSQWIAPNRMRIVWQSRQGGVQTAAGLSSEAQRPPAP